MDIQLCVNSSENNSIGKKVSVQDIVSCKVKDTMSVERPVIMLEYSGDMTNVNYVYIPKFSRYYFVTDVIPMTGGRYELHCYVDVLESYKNQILNLTCIIDKQENERMANKYYNDNSYVALSKDFNRVMTFPNGFNQDGKFILICAGG